MRIEYSKKFIKEFRKCPDNIKKAFKKRLQVFISNERDPVLNNHSLTGRLQDYQSINVNGDWRVIFQKIDSGTIVYFVAIGTHSKLYS